MAKKTARRPKANAQKPQRRPVRSAPHHRDVAGSPQVRGRGWRADEAPYRAWVRAQDSADVGEGIDVLDAKAGLTWSGVLAASRCAQVIGLADDPARWRPHDLADLLDSIESHEEQVVLLEAVTVSLSLYFAFLGQSGRWPADPLDLAVMRSLLDVTAGGDTEVGRLGAQLVSAKDVDPAEEDRAVAALPLLADVVTLLRAVERGAASVSVDPAGKESLEVALAEPLGDGEGPYLAHLWLAVQLGELLERHSTTLTADGAALALSPAGAVEPARRVVSRWLALLVGMPTAWGARPVPGGVLGPMVALVLLHAMSGDGVSREEARAQCAQLDLRAADRDAVAEVVIELLECLVRAGLAVETPDGLVIPKPLVSVVEWGLEQAMALDRRG